MSNEMIPKTVRAEIERRLSAIETDFDVKILFACESGSRAWGFASDDSDYDVRFIYIHPTDWYLTVDLEDRRDVIETPIDDVWDINGWELRKALKLFSKSNPPLLEWLQSPIIYQETTSVAEQMRQLLTTHYSPSACLYHYLHMATKNYRTYLQGEEVWLKKYFYVLRPLLACRWLERSLGAVPTEFNRLVQNTELSPALHQAIANLLEEKRGGGELRIGLRIPELSDFIETELQRFEKSGATRQKPDTDRVALNQLFQHALQEVWKEIQIVRTVDMPNGCFAAGTLVHTKEGLVPIENIKVGDWVLSKPENGGEQAYKRVIQTFVHEPTRVVNVKYEYYEEENRKFAQITTTLNHPFWVVDEGWTEAKDLAPKWTQQLTRIKKKVELCDARHVTIFYVEPIYISEQPGIGWHCNCPPNIQGFGYLWDYVNHQKVAEKVYAPNKIRFDRNGSAYGEERGSDRAHPHTHYLKLPVYNLEVEDFHTYYVGKEGVWVHDAIQQAN